MKRILLFALAFAALLSIVVLVATRIQWGPEALSGHGVAAMGLGVFAVLALGETLIGPLFLSSRLGFDEDAHHGPSGAAKGEGGRSGDEAP